MAARCGAASSRCGRPPRRRRRSSASSPLSRRAAPPTLAMESGGKSVYREYRKLRPVARSVRQRLLRILEQCALQERKAAGVCTHVLCASSPSPSSSDGELTTQAAAIAPADLSRLLNSDTLVNICPGVVRTRGSGGGGGEGRSAAASQTANRNHPLHQHLLLLRRRQPLGVCAAADRRETQLWSAWLQRSVAYRLAMMVCVILHCLCIGLAEDIWSDDAALTALANACLFATVCAFCFDVAIKWTPGFASFWRNPWNALDAGLTSLALLSLAYPPPIAGSRRSGDSSGGGRSFAARLRCVGALRLLSCVRALAALRTPEVPPAVAAVAWRRLLGVAGLFAALAYTYALLGTALFEAYTYSSDADLAYREAFADVGAAMVTLARLASLNWYRLYEDVSRVLPLYVVAPYVVTWIVASHFVLGSLAIGLLAAAVRRTHEWSLRRRCSAVAELRTAER